MKLEIPLEGALAEMPSKVDTGASYIGNKYNALPWKDFIKIKIDANNLINSNTKSALTELDWFHKVQAVYAGQQLSTASGFAAKACGDGAKVKYPMAPK